MENKLVGREREISMLKKYMQSGKPEFVAIYGRRRVGKTYLIRQFFKDKFDFYTTGVIDGTRDEQMKAFTEALRLYGYQGRKPDTWMDAFSQLGDLLRAKAKRKRSPIIVFIDELPCFATLNSRFVRAFGYFWNSCASWIDNIKLIVCGSATSWIIRNVINDRGGLHNRITHQIHLHPFNLNQCETFFRHYQYKWNRLSILQAYMVLGGVPYYLGMLDKEKSVPDNIDALFFSKDAPLKQEFHRLFHSLFSEPENYIELLVLLASNKKGMNRTELSRKLKKSNNGHLGDMLQDLEYCDFIRQYRNGQKSHNAIFQLTDHFTLFHMDFGRKGINDTHFWRNRIATPMQNTWYGHAFERVCLIHVAEIKQALHLDRIYCEYYAWRSKEAEPAAQIDLLLDRADGIITICEMKYSKEVYTLKKKEYDNIQNRVGAFIEENGSRKGVQVVMVTTFGLKQNLYTSVFADKSLVLKDLFKKLID